MTKTQMVLGCLIFSIAVLGFTLQPTYQANFWKISPNGVGYIRLDPYVSFKIEGIARPDKQHFVLSYMDKRRVCLYDENSREHTLTTMQLNRTSSEAVVLCSPQGYQEKGIWFDVDTLASFIGPESLVIDGYTVPMSRFEDIARRSFAQSQSRFERS
uniref:hypothetical protein n=1 Tax=Thaumasiovibrio occultus TaxID=1891184 RepID=UPI000B3545CE|nr:hypothetical protein [Thaumasiovibrio occultus]